MMHRLQLFVLLCAALVLGTLLGASHEAFAGRTSTRYLIFFEPGPAWDYGSSFRLQAGFTKHLAYFKKVYRKKKVVMVGTVKGRDLALVLASPDVSREALKEIAQGDPMVKSQVLSFKIQAWKLDYERSGHKVYSEEDDISDVDLESYE